MSDDKFLYIDLPAKTDPDYWPTKVAAETELRKAMHRQKLAEVSREEISKQYGSVIRVKVEKK